jgi:hypothetical protein
VQQTGQQFPASAAPADRTKTPADPVSFVVPCLYCAPDQHRAYDDKRQGDLLSCQLPDQTLVLYPVAGGLRITSLPYHVTNRGSQPVTMYAPNGTFVVQPGEAVSADEEGNTIKE